MKTFALNSNTEKNGSNTRTVALLWNENIAKSLLTGILEQLSYKTILVKEDFKAEHLETITVEVILYDALPWRSLIEQNLHQLKLLTCSPVLCMIDTNNPQPISERVVKACDDFILKPFSAEELSLRIQWLVKRHQRKTAREKKFPLVESIQINSSNSDTIQKRSYFMIDNAARKVRIKGKPIHLTPKEYKLFCLLATDVGKIFSNQEIIETLWSTSDNATDNDVQQYIYSLRKKIEPDSSNPCFLINAPGFGYKLEMMEDPGDTIN